MSNCVELAVPEFCQKCREVFVRIFCDEAFWVPTTNLQFLHFLVLLYLSMGNSPNMYAMFFWSLQIERFYEKALDLE